MRQDRWMDVGSASRVRPLRRHRRGSLLQGIVLPLVGLLAIVAGGCARSGATASLATLPTASAELATLPTASAELVTPTPGLTPAAGQARFTPAGSADFSAETATLLSDGRVLLAGGESGGFETGASRVLDEVALFDPATGGFSATDSMTHPRSRLTATALEDGSVLVAGGTDGNEGLASAEVYVPTTALNEFLSTGSMTTDRESAAAAPLQGGVLVAGGLGGADLAVLASAERYDSGTGKFRPTGSMASPRLGHTATTLQDGRVLIVGGRGEYPNKGLASAELYEPSTGKFTATGSMAVARFGHTATLLSSGHEVLIVGGGNGETATALAEVYDLDTGKFTAAGSMPFALWYPTATRLRDGRVLVAGGSPTGSGCSATPSAYLWDPATRTFGATGSMATPRGSHTATLLSDGSVLVAGGCNDQGEVHSAELYQP